ncbi:unnamed protein product [Orchesella dallaii]|uniref:C2H2-type domain-containing protein n=1 Tax=Orchesella dallaii TaxID=48710 RepID=A0ABP1S744_9HEXA
MARRNEVSDIATRLERRIKALEKVVTLFSKVVNVDISNFIRLCVNDEVVIKESLAKIRNDKEEENVSFNSKSLSSTKLSPLMRKLNGHKAGKAVRHLSVRKLRINIRNPIPSSSQMTENNSQSSVTFSLPPPPSPSPPEGMEDEAIQPSFDENDDSIDNPNSPMEDADIPSLESDNNFDEDSQKVAASTTTPTSSPSPPEHFTSESSSLPAETKQIKWEPYKCNLCEKNFDTRKELLAHKKEEHKRKKGWRTCPHCSKRFYGNSKYQDHIRTHTKERPFLCNICGVALKTPSSLRYHTKCFHDESGHKETFPCKYCAKVFRTTALKQIHEKRHESSGGHICPHCGGTFVSLKDHIETVHEKNRKYACHLCDHKFPISGNLKRHLKTHENPNRRIKSYHKERPRSPIIRKKRVVRVFEVENEGEGQDKANNDKPLVAPISNTSASETVDQLENEEVEVTPTFDSSNNYALDPDLESALGESSSTLDDVKPNPDGNGNEL